MKNYNKPEIVISQIKPTTIICVSPPPGVPIGDPISGGVGG